jgi:hypothetical protein
VLPLRQFVCHNQAFVLYGKFIDKNTKVMVQGITGSTALFHTKQMLDYGTQIVSNSASAASKIESAANGAGT